MEPDDLIPYEYATTSARAQLGEEEFEQARREGRDMTLDQAIELANRPMEVVMIPSSQRRAGKEIPGGLTAREFEITSLVARGLSNEEIARLLVLSERTVEMHVSNALHRQGLTNRTQLTAWAVQHGLATEASPS